MRPQRQRYIGPGHENQGDCYRTCLAMILDMDRDEVPHFNDGVPDREPAGSELSNAAEAWERAWLAERGLTTIHIPFTGALPIDEIAAQFERVSPGCAVILTGRAPSGGHHAVVLHQGMVFDPNFCGLAGPQADGNWWVSILAACTNPLPPATEQGSVVTQEA